MTYQYDGMLRSLPAAYRSDRWVQDLCSAICQVDDRQRTDVAALAAQMFLDSLTWALALEERIAGITPPAGATIAARRESLAGKWRASSGKADLDLIQRVCDAWKNGEVSVDYQAGEIVLQFIGAFGVPTEQALEALQRAVLEVIPAHLAVQYRYRYLLVREVHGMTVRELQGHKISDFAF